MLELCCCEPRNAKDGWQPPGERTWPWRPLDFRLPVSKMVREYISVVLSHPVCGLLLQQPQETDTALHTRADATMTLSTCSIPAPFACLLLLKPSARVSEPPHQPALAALPPTSRHLWDLFPSIFQVSAQTSPSKGSPPWPLSIYKPTQSCPLYSLIPTC